MKDLYAILILNPTTFKFWIAKQQFVKLTDAMDYAKAKAKQHRTRVYVMRTVEVVTNG